MGPVECLKRVFFSMPGNGIEAIFEVERTSSALHPRRAARVLAGGALLGAFG